VRDPLPLCAGQLLSLAWDEWDRKSGVIRKAKTKNNEAVAIPMDAAVRLSSTNLRNAKTARLVFFLQGEREGEAIKDVKNPFRTALKKVQIENHG